MGTDAVGCGDLMATPFALVIGEVLVDLIEDRDDDGSILYRPRFGGSPLNVAVGVVRLGVDVEFVGAFGHDVFGRRLRDFLGSEGVGVDGSFDTGMGTCLAVAMTDGPRHLRVFEALVTHPWVLTGPGAAGSRHRG